MKVRLTRCYLVQVVDDEGNELKNSYVFGDRETALNEGKSLKEEAKKELEEE